MDREQMLCPVRGILRPIIAFNSSARLETSLLAELIVLVDIFTRDFAPMSFQPRNYPRILANFPTSPRFIPGSWTAILGDNGTSSYMHARGFGELRVFSAVRYEDRLFKPKRYPNAVIVLGSGSLPA
jgi:hypothetical protein